MRFFGKKDETVDETLEGEYEDDYANASYIEGSSSSQGSNAYTNNELPHDREGSNSSGSINDHPRFKREDSLRRGSFRNTLSFIAASKYGNAEIEHDPNAQVFKHLSPQVSSAVKPIFVLLQSQQKKKYFEWKTNPEIWRLNGELINKLSLVGTNLKFKGNGFVEEIDLINCDNIGLNIYLDTSSSTLTINGSKVTCSNVTLLQNLEKLCYYTLFECYQLYKALTGTLIGTMSKDIPDINFILNNNKRSFKDWCEIYLEGSGWTKVWFYVDLKKKSRSIKFYPDKEVQKKDKKHKDKDIICKLTTSLTTPEVFFFNNMNSITDVSMKDFLKSVLFLKIVGDVEFPDDNISQTGILIRPLPHNGVIHLESLIRFILPMMNVLELYGRPQRFATSRGDKDSLMFGLPKLPSIDYLSFEEVDGLLHMHEPITVETTLQGLDFYKNFLDEQFQRNPSRYEMLRFTTLRELNGKTSRMPSIQFPHSDTFSTLDVKINEKTNLKMTETLDTDTSADTFF